MAIQTERVNIDIDGGSMGAYVARPEGDERLPGVIVYMEIFGINSHIRDVAERIAGEGYVAIAPDFFHRTAPGIELGYDDAGMAEGMKHLGQLDSDQIVADARSTLGYLRSRPDVHGEKIGVMGFCIGGHLTYLTACETDVAVAASYYGGGIAGPQGPGGKASTVSRSDGIACPLICYFGGKDAMIPQTQVEEIRETLTKGSKDFEIVVYDDADHGFNCDQRATYHQPSADDAWGRTRALFAQHLKS